MRGSAWTVVGQTSDPKHALETLLARDVLVTEDLRREVSRLGLAAIEIDGYEDVTIANRVGSLFGLREL
jgi:hypothetical protein